MRKSPSDTDLKKTLTVLCLEYIICHRFSSSNWKQMDNCFDYIYSLSRFVYIWFPGRAIPKQQENYIIRGCLSTVLLYVLHVYDRQSKTLWEDTHVEYWILWLEKNLCRRLLYSCNKPQLKGWTNSDNKSEIFEKTEAFSNKNSIVIVMKYGLSSKKN